MMDRIRWWWRQVGGGEHGNATVAVSLLIPVLLIVIAVVVDGGGKLQSADEARWIAQQAARSATQQVDLGQVQVSDVTSLDAAAATAAAQRVIAASGATGSVTLTPDGQGVTVTVTTTYHSRFLQLLRMGDLASTGTATARIERGVTTGGS
jgi:Flp pilus assembly protein TadG